MQCGLKNFIYPVNFNKIRTNYDIKQENKPYIDIVPQNDRFVLSFKGTYHNQFLANFVNLLNNPQRMNINDIKEEVKKQTGKPFDIILDSETTIKRLLIEKYTSKNTDIKNEIHKMANKTHKGEIFPGHGDPHKLYNKFIFPDSIKPHMRSLIGHNISRVGSVFEGIAVSAVENKIIPEIAKKIAKEESLKQGKIILPEEIKPQLKILNNIRLSKLAEFDHTIIRITKDPELKDGEIVYRDFDVVGVVESKYMPIDVNHGFDRRLEDLSWLTNKSSYDKAKYKGTFKQKEYKEYIDEKTSLSYIFTPESFKKYFEIDENDKYNKKHLENLYFVTTNYQLATLNEKLAEIANIAGKNLNFIKFSIENELTDEERNIFRKYAENGLSNNIVFINDDYFGFSLFSFIIYNGLKNKNEEITGNNDFQIFPKCKKIKL